MPEYTSFVLGSDEDPVPALNRFTLMGWVLHCAIEVYSEDHGGRTRYLLVRVKKDDTDAD